MYDNNIVPLILPVNGLRDEVEEASDDSFPASDPPAYTSAAPRKKRKWAEDPEDQGTDKPDRS